MDFKKYGYWYCIMFVTMFLTVRECLSQEMTDYAEGYYSFEEGPGLTPPSARKPPFTQTNGICPGLVTHVNVLPNFHNTLCGDLSLGILPQNPMGQSPLGETYPFELIKNKTLEYLSETLPMLKEDSSIPKVAKFQGQIMNGAFPRKRKKRNVVKENIKDGDKLSRSKSDVVTGRGICDGSDGILCRVFSTFFPQRSGQPVTLHRHDTMETNDLMAIASSTPCPSKAEYATPIFAKNYQGLWRYVVQIPYEGYLTQTVEVTRCLQGQCNFMEGHCLSSPRWVSLLVAEIFYPNAFFPTTPASQRSSTPIPHLDMPAVSDFQNFQQYLNRRAGSASPSLGHGVSVVDKAAEPSVQEYCDGYDQIGCFQIRLFHDWFLVPGACKCWKGLNKNVLLNR